MIGYGKEKIRLIQRFVELGEGFSDLYELLQITRTNKERLHRIIRLDTVIDGKKVCSIVVVLNPVEPGNYMPCYICREGIPHPEERKTGRYTLIDQLVDELKTELCRLVVKPSTEFNELELYYQYLIGVLRMNKFIPNP